MYFFVIFLVEHKIVPALRTAPEKTAGVDQFGLKICNIININISRAQNRGWGKGAMFRGTSLD